jgi:hypothetical protein
MFSNGIYVQTNTGNTLVAAEASYHRERLLEAGRNARLARRARANRTTGGHRSSGFGRLRDILHRTPTGAAAAR